MSVHASSPQPFLQGDALPTLSLDDSTIGNRPNYIVSAGAIAPESAHAAAVEGLRQLLAKCDRNFGFPGIPVGNVFDVQLDAIVRVFQYQVFLVQDGVVGPKTWKAMQADAPVHMPSIQFGSQSMVVRQAQQRLRQYGGYSATLDGEFGEKMQQALVAFQQRHDISEAGVLGPATWYRLSQV